MSEEIVLVVELGEILLEVAWNGRSRPPALFSSIFSRWEALEDVPADTWSGFDSKVRRA
jgi:hypothetical protein